MVTLFRIIFSECGTPVAYGLASSIFFGLAVAIQMKILRIKKWEVQLLYIAFSVSIVQLSHLMINTFIADAVCAGIFFISLAYWLYEQNYTQTRDIKSLLASILLATFGLGAYQFLGLILPILFLACLMIKRTDKGQQNPIQLLKQCVAFFCWCVAILALNFVFIAIGKSACDPQELAVTSSYQASLITWGKLDFVTHFLHIGKQWVTHLLGLGYPGEWIYPTALLPLLLIIKDIRTTCSNSVTRCIYTSVAIAIYVLPFLPIAVMGEDHGARLFLAQPVACASLWALAVAPRLKRLKPWCIAAISIFVSLKASYVVSDMAFYQKRLHEQALVLRSEIVSRALSVNVPEGVDVNACPIVVKGSLYTDIRKNDIYNSCIPAPGDDYLEQYLNLAGMKQAARHMQELAPVFETMPIYPHSGSIKYHHGTILVRLR